MYTSAEELWEGFRKNFLAGFGHNLFLFVVMGLLHIVTFMVPALLLPFLILGGPSNALVLCLTAVGLMLWQRYIVDRWFDWDLRFGLLHPLGVAWFQLLGFQVLRDYFGDGTASWKERDV